MMLFSNIRQSVNLELDQLLNKSDKEELALVQQENKIMEKTKRYSDSEKTLFKELEDLNRSYVILNSSYTSKINEIINIKSKYIENIINLKKSNQLMLLNFSQRIDDLQYKLKDKTHEKSMSCRVCYNEAINIVILPCNHLVM